MTGCPNFRFKIFPHAMPGREAQAPCAIEVPYITSGFSCEAGRKRKEASAGTPISIHDTLLYNGKNN